MGGDYSGLEGFSGAGSFEIVSQRKKRLDGSVSSASAGAASALTAMPALVGLLGWWDATVTGSFVTSVGAIQSVADQSGNGNTLLAGSVGPGLTSGGLNSKPSMNFSDSTTSQSLNNASVAFGTGNTLTVFAVATLAPDLINGFHANGPLLSYTAAGATGAYNNVGSFGLLKLGTTNNWTFDRNGVTQGVTIPFSTPKRIIFTLKSDGVRTLYINGVASTVAGAVNNFVSPGYLSVGGSKLDSSFFGGNYSGDIGEIGIATGYHDATTVAQLDAYLRDKWGLL